MSIDSEFITLRGGLTVPVEPLRLLLDLESRGFLLAPDVVTCSLYSPPPG